ncbi:hypothetical protein BO71DRAFT_401430 [Aspergillus ellipticus CBS 707.79]|uniref:Uncharacterized protein n=1 Tax=Aspergillus ellipticus CBS 707.79 TaxID=1448320 RepID=A0A319DAN7_9EURO|nr:hypothetical protein BO71DRAFT_401430 [Aspergillus ellipticus CBS 707.79]
MCVVFAFDVVSDPPEQAIDFASGPLQIHPVRVLVRLAQHCLTRSNTFFSFLSTLLILLIRPNILLIPQKRRNASRDKANNIAPLTAPKSKFASTP